MDLARPQDRRQTESQATHAHSALLARILRRMAPEMRDSFTTDQRAALEEALAHDLRNDYPVNLRVTLFDRLFLVVIAGRERRSPERRAHERKRHPLTSPGNIAVLAAASLLGLAAGMGLHDLILGR